MRKVMSKRMNKNYLYVSEGFIDEKYIY